MMKMQPPSANVEFYRFYSLFFNKFYVKNIGGNITDNNTQSENSGEPKKNNRIADGKMNFLNFPICPRQESNLYLDVMSVSFYPLNYGGLKHVIL